jgi:hypothetical protein
MFDTKPYRDGTWTSYPYHASRWFSRAGHAFFVEYNYGGKGD